MPRRTLEALLREAVTSPNSLPDRLPMARVFLRTELVQAEEARLRVHMHTAKPSIAPSHSAVTPYNAISAGALSSRYVEQPAHSLAPVLEVILRGSAALRTMLRNLDSSRVHASLGTLLTKVEAAKDLPEAPQPAGFAPGITLHDYQRCVQSSRRRCCQIGAYFAKGADLIVWRLAIVWRCWRFALGNSLALLNDCGAP